MENEAGWHGKAPNDEQAEQGSNRTWRRMVMADKISTRQAYGDALVALGRENQQIIVMDADLSNPL